MSSQSLQLVESYNVSTYLEHYGSISGIACFLVQVAGGRMGLSNQMTSLNPPLTVT